MRHLIKVMRARAVTITMHVISVRAGRQLATELAAAAATQLVGAASLAPTNREPIEFHIDGRIAHRRSQSAGADRPAISGRPTKRARWLA